LSSQLESADDAGGSDAGLGSRAVRGAAITFVRYGGSQALRLAANLVVTRLVVPEAYGLMALVNVLMQGLEMFSDIGIGPSIIRSKRGDDRAFLDTIWTIQLIRGAAIWLIACIAAVPFAAFYGEPLLQQIIPIAGASAVIASLAPTKQWTLNRHLQLGRLTVLDLSSQTLGLVLMIALAYTWRSVWALVWGSIAIIVLRTGFSYLFLPGPNNRFRWEPEARAELLGFGRWVFVSTMLTFLSQSCDRLIFGKLLTMEMVGIYSVGKQMASAPQEAVGHIGSNVVFPFYSRIVTSGQPLPPVFGRARFPLLVLAGWGLAVLAATGDAVIDVLYDDRYKAAGWVVQVLALGAWFTVLWSTNVAALLALGQSKWMAATTGVKTVANIVLIPLGWYIDHFQLGNNGFRGAVIALVVAEVIQLGFSSFAVWRNGLAPYWQDLPLTCYVLASAGVGAWMSSNLVSNNIQATLLGVLVVTLLWLPLGWPLLRKLIRKEGPLIA
jgi:O-antigen/teichoic acid export membrane protein